MTESYESVWAIPGGLFLVIAAVYFFFIRTKMDPRVAKLADLAYQVAAEIAELPARGSTPPVGLKDKPWENRGTRVIGNYKPFSVFGRVLWDRILVVLNAANIWPNTVHEMTHAVRRRNGKPSSEAAAEAAEARANGMRTPEIVALLEKLR